MTESIRADGCPQLGILLVDDSDVFLQATIRFLHPCQNFKVLGMAHNGREALALAEQLQPRVVLLDFHMPVLTGADLLPLLRKLLPDAGIILTTFNTVVRDAMLALGANDYVLKPFVTTDLIPAIVRWLAAQPDWPVWLDSGDKLDTELLYAILHKPLLNR